MTGVSAFWNDERLEQLRLLWISGQSAAQISRHLGNGVSRSAVCGMLHRKGLMANSRGADPGAPTRAYKKPAKSKNGLPLLAEPAPPKPLPPPEPTTATAVTTADLEKHHCKWALNDGSPRWLHCGAQRVALRPYCEFHVAKATGGGTRGERDAA